MLFKKKQQVFITTLNGLYGKQNKKTNYRQANETIS